MVKAWGMETEGSREDSIIKVRVASEQGNNQGRVVSEQAASEQEDLGLRQVKTVLEQVGLDLRQVKIVSEREDLDQQDRITTMVGLVEIFNNSIR